MAAWRCEFYFLAPKTIFYSLAVLVHRMLFCQSKIKFISSCHCVIPTLHFGFTYMIGRHNILVEKKTNNYSSLAHEAFQLVDKKKIETKHLSPFKVDFNPLLLPKRYKRGQCFLLLVGYNKYPHSSLTNQNAALIIDH